MSRFPIAAWVKDRTATSAVEFAIILPVFLVFVFGIVVYGSYLAVVHGVQQIAAEAARASLGGITDNERASLARANITASASWYPLLALDRLTLDSAATDESTRTFTVTVRYDATDMVLFNLPHMVPSPPPIIIRSAAIQRGGY